MLVMSRARDTYRAVTDRCKHCGSLVHVPTFFQATGQKMIDCACSASFKASRHPIIQWDVCIWLASGPEHAHKKSGYTRHVKTHKFVTSLQTSCYTSVHKLSTSCARTACYQFVVTSLKQAVNNL
jgi:hypothetical protein